MESEQPVAEDSASAEPASEAPADWLDLSDDVVYVPSSEDLNLELEPPAPATDGAHFTELELAAGDTWDTDAWGAGFSSEESTDLEIDIPDVPTESPASPGLETIESLTTAAQQDGGVEALDTVAALDSEEPEPAAEFPQAADSEVAAVADQQETTAESEPAAEPEPDTEADEEPHLVAYSPRPPDDEDLAHYEPKGPTVREFFATLGARRPPLRESAQSFTARAAVPSHEGANDYPLAAGAFADLFPDSAVAEEDTRAAFALSGAVTSSPAVAIPIPSVPAAETRTPPPAAPSPEAAQESEEDIRRFREWLDGLAE